MLDYAKIDLLLKGYRDSRDPAAYMAEIWGDLTGAEGDALFQAIDDAIECPHRAEQNMGGACEACAAA